MDFTAGDQVILTTQESRGPGVVVAKSIIDGRLIVRWADGRDTLPRQELLRHDTH